MTTFDLILLLLIGLMGWQGWRSGFIGGALSLVGFGAGALISARFAPMLLPGGRSSQWAPLLALAGAALGGLLLAGALEAVGIRLRKLTPIPFLGIADRGMGLVLGLLVGVAAVWLAATVAVQLPGAEQVRREIRSSKVISTIGKVAPSTRQVLGLVTAFDPLPTVTGLAPVLVAPPDLASAAAPGVRRAVFGVVKVRAQACGFGIEGSGWAAGNGLFVTNAHVVAGDGSPSLESADGRNSADASIAVFDTVNDIAVLRSKSMNALPLALGADPQPGAAAAVLGYPLDGPLKVSPARVGQTVISLTQDAYGRGPVSRTITVLRGNVRPGNSGGPLVSSEGRVIGTVFGRTTGKGHRGGFSVPPSILAGELRRASSGASDPTGPCGH